jgi:hypothetical protein
MNKPFNNNVLIEVLRDDDGVSRTDDTESLKYGKVVYISVSLYHITASSYGEISKEYAAYITETLAPGTIVRWEEFAEGGQTFTEDGKTYALIPWWRIISFKETI